MTRRDNYSDVGAAMREAIAIALEERAPNGVLRVLLALVHEVTSWSRLSASISRSRLADLTGLSPRQVSRSISWLRQHDALFWIPGGSPAGGRRQLSRVTFPKATRDTTDPRSGKSPVTPEGTDQGHHRAPTGDTTGHRLGTSGCPANEDVIREVCKRSSDAGSAPDGAAVDVEELRLAPAELVAKRILATCEKGSPPGTRVNVDHIDMLALDMVVRLGWDDLDKILTGFDEVYGVAAEGETTTAAQLFDWLDMAEGDEISDAVRAWYAGFAGTHIYEAIAELPVDKADAANRLRALSGQVKHG